MVSFIPTISVLMFHMASYYSETFDDKCTREHFGNKCMHIQILYNERRVLVVEVLACFAVKSMWRSDGSSVTYLKQKKGDDLI
jgi:hypothetical protein